jgi:hypothetical protein
MPKPPDHHHAPAAPAGGERSSRFADRSVRLQRQQESRTFRVFLMPPAWLIGLAGMAGLAAFGIEAKLSGTASSEGLRASAAATAVPFVLAAVRLVRGHFNRDLTEP